MFPPFLLFIHLIPCSSIDFASFEFMSHLLHGNYQQEASLSWIERVLVIKPNLNAKTKTFIFHHLINRLKNIQQEQFKLSNRARIIELLLIHSNKIDKIFFVQNSAIIGTRILEQTLLETMLSRGLSNKLHTTAQQKFNIIPNRYFDWKW